MLSFKRVNEIYNDQLMNREASCGESNTRNGGLVLV